MKNKSNIAGIIITRNQEKTIKKSIISMQEQELPLDEIIIVNDSSSDSTKDIIRQLQKKDNRIIPVQSDYQLGPSGSLNLAITTAKSSIALISGGDDFSLPTRSKVQKELLESNSKASILYNRALVNGKKDFFHPLEKMLIRNTDQDLNFFNLLFWNLNFLCAPASAIKINKKSPILFNNALMQLQDYFVNLKLSRADELIWNEAIVSDYTRSQDSLSGKVSNEKTQEFSRYQNELSFIIKNIFESMSTAEIKEMFRFNLPENLIKFHDSEEILKEALQLFLVLSHENKIFQNLGREQLMALEEKPQIGKKIYDILHWPSHITGRFI